MSEDKRNSGQGHCQETVRVHSNSPLGETEFPDDHMSCVVTPLVNEAPDIQFPKFSVLSLHQVSIWEAKGAFKITTIDNFNLNVSSSMHQAS